MPVPCCQLVHFSPPQSFETSSSAKAAGMMAERKCGLVPSSITSKSHLRLDHREIRTFVSDEE
jgi:hypothetical protein